MRHNHTNCRAHAPQSHTLPRWLSRPSELWIESSPAARFPEPMRPIDPAVELEAWATASPDSETHHVLVHAPSESLVETRNQSCHAMTHHRPHQDMSREKQPISSTLHGGCMEDGCSTRRLPELLASLLLTTAATRISVGAWEDGLAFKVVVLGFHRKIRQKFCLNQVADIVDVPQHQKLA